jgi:hypothetical protein
MKSWESKYDEGKISQAGKFKGENISYWGIFDDWRIQVA